MSEWIYVGDERDGAYLRPVYDESLLSPQIFDLLWVWVVQVSNMGHGLAMIQKGVVHPPEWRHHIVDMTMKVLKESGLQEGRQPIVVVTNRYDGKKRLWTWHPDVRQTVKLHHEYDGDLLAFIEGEIL